MFCPHCGRPSATDASFCQGCGKPLQPIATDLRPATPPATDHYAGIGRRFFAQFIDGLLLSLVFGMGFGGPLIIMGVVWVAYQALLESSTLQATVGKLLLGIVVTDTNGQRIGLPVAAVRAMSKVLSGVLLMNGYIMALFTARRQALHDLIAGTLVLRKTELSPSPV
jgi:uncharacterized RDD family membrane protein YckC